MGTRSTELLIELDRSRRRGLRVQIETQLREAIRAGRLNAGTLLPSSRALAADLGVTRRVVVEAYDQLLAEGYLAARPRSGTVVNAAATKTAPRPRRKPRTDPISIDFRTAAPDLSLFPRAAWLRAARAAFQALPDAHLGYTDPRGLPELRQAVAGYVGRVRGVIAEADQVVICNGFGQALTLLARVLHDLGHEGIAVEDPSHDNPRDELDWLGVRQSAVAVDADGIIVDCLRQTSSRAVLTTPAHQFPTGGVLVAERRHALVAWAHDINGYVIEDDYDAEFRYDRHPVGALQGLAPDRVIYAGTVSKSLAPGLRFGWLILPPQLVDPVATSRQRTDHATSTHLQATFTAFLANGDLDRHLRRARRVYHQRRDVLIEALDRWMPNATTSGIAAGLHVVLTLPAGLDEHRVAARAATAGVRVYPLSSYRIAPRPDAPPALVLGYGSLAPRAIQEGVRALARAAS